MFLKVGGSQGILAGASPCTGPMTGESVGEDVAGTAGSLSTDIKLNSVSMIVLLTWHAIQMPLDLCDELPYVFAAVWILKRKSNVQVCRGLRPDD